MESRKKPYKSKKTWGLFEKASTILRDPKAISIFDKYHSETEERWITIGIDETGVLIVMCHTFLEIDNRRIIIRIISARKATKDEIKQYRSI